MQHWAREGIAGTVIRPIPLCTTSMVTRMVYTYDCVAPGRGVLIDYASYAEKNGIKYSTFSTHQIRLSDILKIAKECNITFQRGDILLVRIGVTKEWDTVMSNAQKQDYSISSNPEHAGVEATTEVLRWLWDTGFSAIAGDAISWEVCFWIPCPFI